MPKPKPKPKLEGKKPPDKTVFSTNKEKAGKDKEFEKVRATQRS